MSSAFVWSCECWLPVCSRTLFRYKAYLWFHRRMQVLHDQSLFLESEKLLFCLHHRTFLFLWCWQMSGVKCFRHKHYKRGKGQTLTLPDHFQFLEEWCLLKKQKRCTDWDAVYLKCLVWHLSNAIWKQNKLYTETGLSFSPEEKSLGLVKSDKEIFSLVHI